MATGLKHPISILQELFQLWKLPLPEYRECEGSFQEFGTEVTVTTTNKGDKFTLSALGRTKKASKASVAQAALDYLAKHYPHLLETPVPPQVSLRT